MSGFEDPSVLTAYATFSMAKHTTAEQCRDVVHRHEAFTSNSMRDAGMLKSVISHDRSTIGKDLARIPATEKRE